MIPALLVLLALGDGPPPAPPFDPLPVLRDYLRIDTSNPPGNERAAAEFLKAILDREGIPAELVEVAPGRADLVARLSGDGSKRALLLTHHMDVVQADRAKWTADPFGAEIRDGFLYGRGTLDMKTTAIVELAALVRLKREKIPLCRDVVYIGTADEEIDALGMQKLIDARPEIFRGAELSLTEGAAIDLRGNRERSWNVSTAEKAVLWLKLTARGRGGHASIPPAEGTAVTSLVRALDRLAHHEMPIVVLPAVQAYFAALADRFDGLDPAKLRSLGASLSTDAAFRAAFLSDPERAAQVRNTIAITVLRGGPQTNVIPSEASAEVDCRLLPGQDPKAVIEEIRAAVADPAIEIVPLQPVVATSASPTGTDLYRAIVATAARVSPGVPVVPALLTSWTESALLRPLGIAAYGFEPIARDADEARRAHGDDERIALANVTREGEILFAIVKRTVERRRK
jgi:acetylornithine deacetylase/succinyl-diaminopimelate desuccinylase-like protein